MPDLPHPSQSELLAYALGELGIEQVDSLKAHLTVCETCQAIVRATEEAEGYRLMALPGEPLAEDALQRALDQLDPKDDKSEPDQEPPA